MNRYLKIWAKASAVLLGLLVCYVGYVLQQPDGSMLLLFLFIFHYLLIPPFIGSIYDAYYWKERSKAKYSFPERVVGTTSMFLLSAGILWVRLLLG